MMAKASESAGAHRFLIGVCVLVTLGSLAGGFWWSFYHKYGTSFDEPNYFGMICQDVQAIHHEGLFGIARRLAGKDTRMPPLVRWMGLPILALTGVKPWIARCVAAGYFLISLGLLGATGKRLAGGVGAAVGIALVCVHPHIIAPIFRYGTEFPLVLGVAMCIYFMARLFDEPVAPWPVYFGLGVGLAIGSLSKVTFAPIILPLLLATGIRALRSEQPKTAVMRYIAGCIIGGIIIAPWYAINLGNVLAYGQDAQEFSRHGLQNRWEYPEFMIVVVFGVALSLAVAMILGGTCFNIKALRENAGSHARLWFMITLLISPLPVLIMHLASSNHNPRFLGPSFVPFMLGLGILATWTNWQGRWVRVAPLGLVLIAHLIYGVLPLIDRPMEPSPRKIDQWSKPAYFIYPMWDWNKLREHPDIQWSDEPSVIVLGNSHMLGRIQVEWPWISRGEPSKIRQLINYASDEDLDAFNFEDALERTKQFDVAVTAPGYFGWPEGGQPKANVFNDKYAQMLRDHPDFSGPIILEYEDLGPVQVWAFVNEAKKRNDKGLAEPTD